MAKYPWGDDTFPMPVFMGLVFVLSPITGAILYMVGNDAAVAEDAAPGLKALSPVALASIAWVAMMYTFFGGQVVAKFEPEPDEKVMEISLRTMMNTLEQAPCFFISMWLHAIFVNPEIAGVLGLFYVAARFFYGYLYGMYGQFTMAAELTTQPNCELLRPHSREPRTWAPV
jgi:hypothetical protein